MDLNEYGIKSFEIKELGSIALFKPFLEMLKLAHFVDQVAPMDRQRDISHGQVIETLVANRLDEPLPLLHIQTWAEQSGLEKAYDIAPEKLNDDRLGRALEAIAPHIEEIQAMVAFELIERYQIDPGLVLWDTTSCYFEGAYDDSEMIGLGYSRDHRPDKKQVVVGLNLSKEGVPLFHQTLPGNSTDKKVALENIRVLQKNLKPKTLLLVGDRAIFTRQNIVALQKRQIKYLGPYAATEKDFILAIAEEEYKPLDYTTSKGKDGYFGVDTVICFNDDKKAFKTRALVVKSEEKAVVDTKTRNKQITKIEAGLKYIASKLNERKYKKYDYVKEQVAKLFFRKKKYRLFFTIDLSGTDGALTLEWSLNQDALTEAKRLDGKYILVTNLADYSATELIQLYKSRHLNESRFRNFKSDLKVRPLFLQNDDRIKALIFINILALTLYCLIEWLYRKFTKSNVTARTILDSLRRIALVEIRMNTGQSGFKLANINDEIKTIFNSVGVTVPDG